MASATPLSPFVYWAQDKDSIHLKIELRNAEEPSVHVEQGKQLRFTAVGDGARGRHTYSFSLDLFDVVDVDVSQEVGKSFVRLVLTKSSKDVWWDKLISGSSRPAWLKIDFDRWYDPFAEASDSESGKVAEAFNQEEYEKYEAKRMVDQMLKDMGPKEHRDFRYQYLIVYNVAMFLGYFILFVELISGYNRDGEAYFAVAYQNVAAKMICCQLAQFFEIAHSLLGYVKSGWIAPTLQTLGRGFILFVLLGYEPRLQDKPVVFYLFAIWAMIELFRYPYYFLTLLASRKLQILHDLASWLRYTLWIPLYPLGFLCEGVLVIRAIPYFYETKRFTVPLPNAMNVGIDFPFLLQIYLVFLFLPGFAFLMSHMRNQRIKKMGTGSANKFKKN